MKEGTFSYRRLMFTTFIISGCSIIYELLISSVSSYLLGDSIAQFSITIGLYMCAMGMGSYLSKYVRTLPFPVFSALIISEGWQDPLRFRCSCCLSWDIFPLPFWWAV